MPSSGSGFGSGFGFGFGYGDGFGDGSGSGSGSGYGDGSGYGSGSGDGYGSGSGYGFGYGDGSGYGFGDGYGEKIDTIGDWDVRVYSPWPYLSIGCEVHSLEHWSKHWRESAAQHDVTITEHDAVALLARADERPTK